MKAEVGAEVAIHEGGKGDRRSIRGDRRALLDGVSRRKFVDAATVEPHPEDVATDIPFTVKDDRVRRGPGRLRERTVEHCRDLVQTVVVDIRGMILAARLLEEQDPTGARQRDD